MTYDYSGPHNPGPNAPVNWIRSTLRLLLGTKDISLVQHKASKIFLGINFYGYDFSLSGGRNHSIFYIPFIWYNSGFIQDKPHLLVQLFSEQYISLVSNRLTSCSCGYLVQSFSFTKRLISISVYHIRDVKCMYLNIQNISLIIMQINSRYSNNKKYMLFNIN